MRTYSQTPSIYRSSVAGKKCFCCYSSSILYLFGKCRNHCEKEQKKVGREKKRGNRVNTHTQICLFQNHFADNKEIQEGNAFCMYREKEKKKEKKRKSGNVEKHSPREASKHEARRECKYNKKKCEGIKDIYICLKRKKKKRNKKW